MVSLSQPQRCAQGPKTVVVATLATGSSARERKLPSQFSYLCHVVVSFMISRILYTLTYAAMSDSNEAQDT